MSYIDTSVPRSPWQMSVLLAPPRMNCGLLQISCFGKRETVIIIYILLLLL